MGTKFSVADNAVNTLSTNLDTAVSGLQAQGASFLTAIEPLSSVWKGKGFASWEELTTAWDNAMKGLNGALTSIKTRVGNAGVLYDQYHDEQAADLASIAGSANWDGAKFTG